MCNLKDINKIIDDLDNGTDDSINTDFFTEDETKINISNNISNLFSILTRIFGFYLIFVFTHHGILPMIFEIILICFSLSYLYPLNYFNHDII